MKRLIVKSGIKEEVFQELLDRSGEIPELMEALDNIFRNSWTNANKIYNTPHMTDETWAMYDALEIRGTYEQVLLADALRVLKNDVLSVVKNFLKR